MRLIVGLGNPGTEYEGTRHNVGFEVIQILARRHQIPLQKRGFKAVYGSGVISGQRVMLVQPMTYMNLSGEAVGSLARFYKIEPSDVMVILDEVALPPGRLRLRMQGSAGGHNGLVSVLQHMQTQAIPRIRIGVGNAGPGKLIGHVLSRFSPAEITIMREACEKAADAVECALAEGFENAMNRYNVREKPLRGEAMDRENDL